MTSRDVIVVLQRSAWRKTQRRIFPFARVADIVLAAFWLAWLVAMMGGCSVDNSNLSPSLVRGRVDVDALEVATSGETATPPDSGTAIPDSGMREGNSGSSPDGGTTDSDQNAGSVDVGQNIDVTVPPSVCAFDPTLSLTPCDRQTALCRTYDTPGHAVYETACTVEGYVCVGKCPT